MTRLLLAVALVALAALPGCNERAGPVVTAAVSAAPPAAAPAFSGPVLGPDGRCQGQSAATAAAIETGIGECDLVRLKGKEPTDVLIGESGKGHREVQVLYSEPGGREIYLFVNNRLDRIVR
ncbi:MAG TPA: hypothetical protein VHN20_00555 [Beijerinckiaceae bacterium]|nr:hypothetical protein [Beijerinckiaceae bacterium]